MTMPNFRGGNGGNGGFQGNRPGRGANGASTDPNVATETLAMQTINGVQATGTRVTRTIPAGQIGNAQPIQIVTETWHSPDLKIPVMVKTNRSRARQRHHAVDQYHPQRARSGAVPDPSDYTVTKGRGPGGKRGENPCAPRLSTQ